MDYRQAGVDIAAADEAKARIKGLARTTFNPAVLSEIGSFGGMFRPTPAYDEPVLVASTDGVGTKIQVARLADRPRHRGLRPRRPLRERHPRAGRRRRSSSSTTSPSGRWTRTAWRASCRGSRAAARSSAARSSAARPPRCPAPTRPDDYDLAGFIVGVVERRKALTGAGVREGDVLIGLPSAGLHTNGYIAGAQGAVRALRPRVDTAAARAGHHRGRGAPGPAPLLPRRSGAAARARTDPRPRATSPAAASRATSRASCPRAWARAIRRGSWAVPPLFRLSRRAAESPTTRCSAPSTWASA